MHAAPLLIDILYLLGISVLVVLIFQSLKLPTVIGFLASGVIIGPSGLSLVAANEEVEMLAEIGVIFLLFVIGLEFSIKKLASIRKTVLLGGSLQVIATIIIVTLVVYFFVDNLMVAVFIGFLFSLSSSALVFKMLQDRNEMDMPHGRFSLGILIFQDVIVVPMMLITPIMAGNTDNVFESVAELAIKTLVIVVFTLLSARYVVPKLMHLVAKTRSNEIFIFTTLTICLGVAVLTEQAGLSLAFGAFIAGLIISESEYSHRAVSLVLPFRELFTGFFFISIGMLLNLGFLWENIAIVLPVLVLVFLLKSLIVFFASSLLKYPFRSSVVSGLALFQVGEFSFILSQVGIENGLLTPELNQYFLSISILSMISTPFIMGFSGNLSNFLSGKRSQKRRRLDDLREEKIVGTEDLQDHLVIIGFGLNGKNVAKAARLTDIPYIIIEFNAKTVKAERGKGEKIFYGDASNDFILHKANIEKARVAIVAISDPGATKRIVSNIRTLTQSVHLIVRTRFISETDELLLLGADEVIPEEFETSIEIFSRALHRYLIPAHRLENIAKLFRSDNYELLTRKKESKKIRPLSIPEINIEAIRIISDSGSVIGKSLADSDIRKKFRINILGINRQNEFIQSGPEEVIRRGDVIYVCGKPDDIVNFSKAIS
ncbi:monovalent cation:proton antiporter family protein [Mangrovivirga cuniculi]|uniref:Potassium transporter KefB n=1 Tax=Mangrovivirga cuniculi TaxID=2715131 RepID=A0A4D7JPL1_9BACT|nr:monovalent cation:proton antiporter family protein [Mangrovivirga cuniculi]QCK15430.1 potassium transporter KefB [Mangrovivirga cuniculi]